MKIIHFGRIRKKIMVITVIAVICGLTIFQAVFYFSSHFVLINKLWTTNKQPLRYMTCYDNITEDTLPRADDPFFKPPAKSIFFHETSCKGDIDARQACAVESAAAANPSWQINLIFLVPVKKTSFNTGILALLRSMNNVKFLRANVVKYATGTPLEAVVSGGDIYNEGLMFHLSDVFRYLSLYKFGGIYFDLDVLVAKPMDMLARNWAARESDNAVASGALAFSRDKLGRLVAESAVRAFQSNHSFDIKRDWGYNGPGIITRWLEKRCHGESKNWSAATCYGFEVYDAQFFYPVHWTKANVYFEPGVIDEETAYCYHVWGKITSSYKVDKGSPYSRLAKKYCPNVYKSNPNNFGQ